MLPIIGLVIVVVLGAQISVLLATLVSVILAVADVALFYLSKRDFPKRRNINQMEITGNLLN